MKNLNFVRKVAKLVMPILVAASGLWAADSQALPAFARQTGHNCVACHAGGQFPELTPYGRIFKMTGYTIGEKSMNVAIWGAAGANHVKNINSVSNAVNNQAPNGGPYFPGTTVAGQAAGGTLGNGGLDVEAVSAFLAGRVSDNVGVFIQASAQNGYQTGVNGQGGYAFGSDNMEIRYADQIVSPSSDLIYGFAFNNNPSMSDPWNTVSAWSNYVPSSSAKGANAFNDSTTPYPSNAVDQVPGSPGNTVAGLTAYGFLNKTYYGEVGLYRSATNLLSVFQWGNTTPTYLTGLNPYWRLAYNKEWGPNSLMFGASGMTAHNYDPANGYGTGTGDSNNYFTARVQGMDMQYQYLLDPHAVTVTMMYQNVNLSNTTNVGDAALSDGSHNIFRTKGTYVYQSRYGTSYSYFNATDGSARGNTYEAFYIPFQNTGTSVNLRVGVQYTTYSELSAVTGGGAPASDANTLRFYAWFVY